MSAPSRFPWRRASALAALIALCECGLGPSPFGLPSPLTAVDAGPILDSGDSGSPPIDAGMAFDAGPPLDAGSPIDAGPVFDADGGVLFVDGGSVGSTCSSDGDCQEGLCIKRLADGYCTSSCGGNVGCPSGSSCEDVQSFGSYCVATCMTSNDCRATYECTEGLCLPVFCIDSNQCGPGETCDPSSFTCTETSSSCQTNADCSPGQSCTTGQCIGMAAAGCTANTACPLGETCETGTGICSGGTSNGPPAGDVGAPCTGGRLLSNCAQGPLPRCLGPTDDFTGGYCSSTCAQNADCDGTNLCVPLHNAAGTTVNLCMQACSTNADCRPNYNCVQSGGQSFCLNQCQANADCPNPATQVCNSTTGLCSP